jgi:hypothetical protein
VSPNAGGCGVSANENSCAHHMTWSPNKLWRSNSIFNLWEKGSAKVCVNSKCWPMKKSDESAHPQHQTFIHLWFTLINFSLRIIEKRRNAETHISFYPYSWWFYYLSLCSFGCWVLGLGEGREGDVVCSV